MIVFGGWGPSSAKLPGAEVGLTVVAFGHVVCLVEAAPDCEVLLVWASELRCIGASEIFWRS